MTAKELNGIIDDYVGGDLKNPRPIWSDAVYREAVPLVIRLSLAKAKAYDWARKIGSVLEALTNSTGIYATGEPDALDEPLSEIRDGVFNSVVAIDGVEYRFTRSVGDPKRLDDSAITQSFLANLPQGWTKPKSGVELDKKFLMTCTPSQLKAKGLYLPDRYTWKDEF